MAFNNSSSTLNPFIYNTWEKVGIILANAVIFCFAIPANGIVIVVISRVQNVRTPTSTFLLNLCVADILMASLYIPFITVDLYITNHWVFGGFMCRLVTFVYYVATYFSILILTAISVERYISVCLPRRLRLTAKKAFVTTVVLWLIAVSTAMPLFIAKELVPYPMQNNLKYCLLRWTLKTRKIYAAVTVTLFYVMPIAVITMVYYKIGRKVWSSAGRTRSMKLSNKHASNSKLRLTKIALAIVLSFALSWTPLITVNALRLFDGNFPYSYNFAHIAYPIILWAAFSNCAVNPLLYCFMSQNFRKAFTIFRNRRSRSYIVESNSAFSRSSSKRFSRRGKKHNDEQLAEKPNGELNENENLRTNSENREVPRISQHDSHNTKDTLLIVSAL